MIHTLHKQGKSIREISRITGFNRRTISKRLKQESLEPYKKRKYNSILDPYKSYIKKRYEETLPKQIPSSVILREIIEYGYTGKLRLLQTYLSTLRNNLKQDEPIIRFETKPGKQAQVDWTILRSGKNPLYAFVIVLGYSRAAFVCITDNMKQDTWQECHLKAFSYFGGVPETILYDNLKSVVTQRDKYGLNNHSFNKEFIDFSKGLFVPKLCKPFRAKTKGKVERFNHYLKNNFYEPLKSALKNSGIEINKELLNSHISKWLYIANSRVHNTLKAKPFDLLKDEVKYLNKYHKEVKPIKENKEGVAHIPTLPQIDISYFTTISDYEKLLGATL